MSEKKWYAVYTKPRWEKKVAENLTKKNIENYCPLNMVQKQWADRKKIVMEPLFNCYVFVHVTEADHLILKKTDGVINLVYWLGKPAVIRDAEIDMIQRFLYQYRTVQLEKTAVNLNDMARIISGPLMNLEGRITVVTKKTVKMILPSLGYSMCAEVEVANVEVIKNKNVYKKPVDY